LGRYRYRYTDASETGTFVSAGSSHAKSKIAHWIQNDLHLLFSFVVVLQLSQLLEILVSAPRTCAFNDKSFFVLLVLIRSTSPPKNISEYSFYIVLAGLSPTEEIFLERPQRCTSHPRCPTTGHEWSCKRIPCRRVRRARLSMSARKAHMQTARPAAVPRTMCRPLYRRPPTERADRQSLERLAEMLSAPVSACRRRPSRA
jgi:hypothetical protein